jgi:hypothetical protein
MVRLQGTQRVETSVEVSESQILEEAERITRKRRNINPEDFLKGINIMYDDPDHRHGSITEYVLRKATAADLIAFDIIGYLDQLKHRDPK